MPNSNLDKAIPLPTDSESEVLAKISVALSYMHKGDLSFVDAILNQNALYRKNRLSLVDIALFEAVNHGHETRIQQIVSHPVIQEVLAQPKYQGLEVWDMAVIRDNREILARLYCSDFKKTFTAEVEKRAVELAYGNGYGKWDAFEYLLTQTSAGDNPYLETIDTHYENLCATYHKIQALSNSEEDALRFYEKYKILREQKLLKQNIEPTDTIALPNSLQNSHLPNKSGSGKLRKI